ncbi:hypothetical protein LZ32DRAFT_276940 [Colletotrichum eremochloae]|nr:hypothetical protein LZ32DRAFT_276940 [Colletotrichum eremochloae]
MHSPLSVRVRRTHLLGSNSIFSRPLVFARNVFFLDQSPPAIWDHGSGWCPRAHQQSISGPKSQANRQSTTALPEGPVQAGQLASHMRAASYVHVALELQLLMFGPGKGASCRLTMPPGGSVPRSQPKPSCRVWRLFALASLACDRNEMSTSWALLYAPRLAWTNVSQQGVVVRHVFRSL